MIYLIGIGIGRDMVNYVYLSDRPDSGRLFTDYHDCILDKCEGDNIDIAIINVYNALHSDSYMGEYADKYGRAAHVYRYGGERRIEDLKPPPPRSERQDLIDNGFPPLFLGEYSRRKAIEYYHRLYEDEDLGIRVDTGWFPASSRVGRTVCAFRDFGGSIL